MRIKLLLLVICLFFTANIFSMPSGNIYQYQTSAIFPQVKDTFKILDFNNIKAYFWSSGIFNRNMNLQNAPGFFWPKNSNNTACYSAGLSMACRINGQLAESMASFIGEFKAGCVINHQPYTDSTFKYYSVKKTDNIYTNPDYANWYLMVPYGAPFKDVNNNGVYDQGIDIPGVPNSSQTIFVCMTDAFPESHNIGEGIGGGVTNPLMMAEVHFTAFTYDLTALDDAQYMKWEIINKGEQPWQHTFFSVTTDPDLGYGLDDDIGCDIGRNLGYCYNHGDTDMYYGVHPPAFGITLLKGPVIGSDTLPMTSFTYYCKNSNSPSICLTQSNGEPGPSYICMKGFLKDSTPFLNPTIPLGQGTRKTKYCFSGDPETQTGWLDGNILINCSGDTIGTPFPPFGGGDRRFLLSTGSEDLTIQPNEKQTIFMAQLIARGTSNLNSVTKLKLYCDEVRNLYNTYIFVEKIISGIIPNNFELGQNYPNPFNPVTTITYDLPINTYVDIRLYDITGKEIQRLVNERQTAGTYKISFDGTELPSGIYFYRMATPTFTESKKMVLVK
jgi:hypothetical protein